MTNIALAITCLLGMAEEGYAITTSVYDNAALLNAKAAAAPAPAPASASDKVKLQTCKDKISSTFNVGATSEQSTNQFKKFVDDVCPSLDLKMPNGVMVSSCFHTGFFLVRNLRPLQDKVLTAKDDVKQAQEDMDTYVEDFCTNYSPVLPMRTDFVKTIYNVEDKDAFTKACIDKLSATPTLNTWFDPIDPLSSITSQEICDLNYKLFTTLKEKQRTSLSEFVSFSYLASLDLFLNAQMQEDYENCVNLDVIADPNQWITNFITEHPSFKIWDNQGKLDVAATTATAIQTACADSATCAATGQCQACDGCSIGISRIFKTFQSYMNKLYADTFKDHSEKMFNKLHEANLAIESK